MYTTHCEAEARAHGRRRDAVLAGAGLGDDARLAHAPSEQHLPDRVVDLVRAGVIQVFALEIDAGADALRQSRRVAQDRRPARRSRAACRRATHETTDRPWPRRTRTSSASIAGMSVSGRIVRRTCRIGRAPASHGIGRHSRRTSSCHSLSVSPRRRTASRKARIRAWSLIPGALSTPDDTSTTSGATMRTACATFSGFNPPASTTRARTRCAVECSRDRRPSRTPCPCRRAAPGHLRIEHDGVGHGEERARRPSGSSAPAMRTTAQTSPPKNGRMRSTIARRRVAVKLHDVECRLGGDRRDRSRRSPDRTRRRCLPALATPGEHRGRVPRVDAARTLGENDADVDGA